MDHVPAAARLFGVLAHPGRLGILVLLGRTTERSVTELQDALGLERTLLQHQLRILRESQLVRVTRDGRHKRYALADHHVGHIVRDALAHVAEPAEPAHDVPPARERE